MILINPIWFKEYLAELKVRIDKIHNAYVLVDPSEIANFVKEDMVDREISVFAVLPDIHSEGENIDVVKFKNTIGFRVVEKTDYHSFENQDEWLQVYHRTSEVVTSIVDAIIKDISNPEYCEVLSFLDSNSIRIVPIWKESHCNGWDIELDIKL